MAQSKKWLSFSGEGVHKVFLEFFQSEQGQDLVEYSLLLAFVCLAGAAAFIGMGRNTSGIWNIVNNRLANANQS
jgi:Flp pilus assembly pilin Flp